MHTRQSHLITTYSTACGVPSAADEAAAFKVLAADDLAVMDREDEAADRMLPASSFEMCVASSGTTKWSGNFVP